MTIEHIGIDPGLSGGIAFIYGSELYVWDMPVIQYQLSNKKWRREVNIGKLASIIRSTDCNTCTLEKLQGMGKVPFTEFRLGEAYGMTKAALVLTGTTFDLAAPTAWKKHFGLTKDKDAARELAQKLFPERASSFSRKKDDGKAEAALIAHYGLSMLNLNSSRKD